MDKINQIIKQSNGAWKTQSEFFSWLRGQFRRAWSRHPVRISYKNSREYPAPPGYYGKAKKLVDCESCLTPTPKSYIEVDHIESAGSLRSLEDLFGFIQRLLIITWDDLRCLCKPCHEIITLAKKHNYSFEQAKLEKEVIVFKKKSAKEQLYFLKAKGYTEEACSNAAKRIISYRNFLTKRVIDD